MIDFQFKFVAKMTFIALLVMIASCSGPNTPQEVTQTFWRSVIKGNIDEIVKYSTLSEAKQYDAFSRTWTNYTIDIGRVAIDNDHASIETKMSAANNSEEGDRVFTTYLVMSDKQWLVDYAETRDDIQGGPLGGLLEKLGHAGKTLTRQLGEAANDLDIEFKRLGEKIEKRAKSLDKETRRNLNEISEKMRRRIEELQRSIQRALEDVHWSDRDRKILSEVSDDLGEENRRLSDNDLEAFAESGKNIAHSQRRLNDISTNNAESYKKDWNSLIKDIKQNLSDMADSM